MPNKKVPQQIGGVELCPASRARTATLIRSLEEAGVTGITQTKSSIDRIRLLAHHIFSAGEEAELAPTLRTPVMRVTADDVRRSDS